MYIHGLYIRELGPVREVVDANNLVVLRSTITAIANLLEVTAMTWTSEVAVRTFLEYIESTFSNLTSDQRLLKLIRPIVSIESTPAIERTLHEHGFAKSEPLFATTGSYVRREYFVELAKPEPSKPKTSDGKRDVHIHIHTA